MSNIQKPYPGTRDFYMQRNLSETPERSKRIEAKNALVGQLQNRVYREVACQLPEGALSEEEMSNEALINNRAFQNVWIAEKYQLSEVSSQIQKVLQNRGKDMGQLYGTSKLDPVYKFLVELRGAIWDNPGLLDNIEDGHDELTREMSKEWAAGFLENWISSFENRVHLDTEHYNDTNRDKERGEWSMERKYDLLGKANNLSPEKRTHFIQQFCLKVPPFSGVELDWDDIHDMYEDARDNTALVSV